MHFLLSFFIILPNYYIKLYKKITSYYAILIFENAFKLLFNTLDDNLEKKL